MIAESDFPSLGLKRGQIGEESADAFADPVGERRAGDLLEGAGIDVEHVRRFFAGVGGVHGGAKGGFLVVSLQQVEEGGHFDSVVWAGPVFSSGVCSVRANRAR